MSTDINRINYEQYVIDYLEGQLDAETKNEFLRFLEANPEYKTEIEVYLEAPALAKSNAVFAHKNTLLKRRAALWVWMLLGILILAIPSSIYVSHLRKSAFGGSPTKKMESKPAMAQNETQEKQVKDGRVPEAQKSINESKERSTHTQKDTKAFAQTESNRKDKSSPNDHVNDTTEKLAQRKLMAISDMDQNKTGSESSIQSESQVPSNQNGVETPQKVDLVVVDMGSEKNISPREKVSPIALLETQQIVQPVATSIETKVVVIKLPLIDRKKDQGGIALAETKKRNSLKDRFIPQAFENLDEQIDNEGLLAEGINNKNLLDKVSERIIPISFTK